MECANDVSVIPSSALCVAPHQRFLFRCSTRPLQPPGAETLEQRVAYFALPSRKTFAATAVYSCCYKNSSLKCRAAGCEGCSAVAGANFSLLLLRSDVFYTCDNSFPIPYRTETNDAATLNAVTRCHRPLRTQDAFAAAAE